MSPAWGPTGVQGEDPTVSSFRLPSTTKGRAAAQLLVQHATGAEGSRSRAGAVALAH